MIDEDDLPDLTRLIMKVAILEQRLEKAFMALEIHRAELKMIAPVLEVVCLILPEDSRALACEELRKRADIEPLFVNGARNIEEARGGIVRVAAKWSKRLKAAG